MLKLKLMMGNKSYWLVGASDGKGKDWTDEFIEKKIWENRWEKPCNIKIGDKIAIKTSVIKKSAIYVKAIGEVTGVINNHTFNVNWTETNLYDRKNFNKVRAIHKITEPKEIQQIFKSNYLLEKEKAMKEYIVLLKSNKNIVLTGAPGTGKTYLAKKIAENIIVSKINKSFNFDEISIKEYIKEKEIVKTIENYSFSITSITDNNIKVKPDNAKNEYSVPRKDIIECLKNKCYNKSVTESNKGGVGSYIIGIANRIITKIIEPYISFVQFHPSYDYTDFVEGLRPKKEKDSKELGFELKNGIFKEFCKKAKDNGIFHNTPKVVNKF